jgi:two-component system, chemotaxis family, protein-glutamate methylesterase/glutaminase
MVDLVRVLIVDDSAYVRKVIRQMLSRSPFIEIVGVARDGREALELAAELKPDVITCDLIMPELDGAGFIREQMARQPIPIVVVSVASESGELVLAALDAGAVDFVQKPTALATDRLLEIGDELVEKVKVAARAHPAVSRAPVLPALRPPSTSSAFDIVVIGISTGGPQALKLLIPKLPAGLAVPVAIVLHMPVGYTELYARKLNDQSAVTVLEAQGGELVTPAHVYLAPAGRHLTLRRNRAGEVTTHLDVRPLDTPYKPSVDSLFHSAADVYGSRVLGLVMTGMGSDGREGSAWIKAKGGTVLTESEASCVVYGMPRSIVEAGLSDGAVRLEQMADAVLQRV